MLTTELVTLIILLAAFLAESIVSRRKLPPRLLVLFTGALVVSVTFLMVMNHA